MLWVKDKDVLVAIARGGIKELAQVHVPIWRYPLPIRRTTYGVSYVMGSDYLYASIRQQVFPETRNALDGILQTSDQLAIRTTEIVDPLIREGILVMTKPTTHHSEQDLYWADEAWFIQNVKGRTPTYVP